MPPCRRWKPRAWRAVPRRRPWGCSAPSSDTVRANYLRIDPVSSREQYRWMERYIPMVEDVELRAKLAVSIDGKGAFRRFKDVLMSYATERERWFAFRSERLRIFMEAWLNAHALRAVPRPTVIQEPPPVEEQAPVSTGESKDLAPPSSESREG